MAPPTRRVPRPTSKGQPMPTTPDKLVSMVVGRNRCCPLQEESVLNQHAQSELIAHPSGSRRELLADARSGEERTDDLARDGAGEIAPGFAGVEHLVRSRHRDVRGGFKKKEGEACFRDGVGRRVDEQRVETLGVCCRNSAHAPSVRAIRARWVRRKTVSTAKTGAESSNERNRRDVAVFMGDLKGGVDPAGWRRGHGGIT